MRKLFPLLFLVLALPAFAQTTYTVTQDSCGAKNLGYCQMQTDGGIVTLDHRYTGSGPIDNMTFPDGSYVHGSVSGFLPNPNGTRNAYYGVGSFVSDDGTVNATLQFYAYYVGSCSGRGCGPVVVGWHYRILTGSVIEVN